MNKELIAKVKFWFGGDQDIFKNNLILDKKGDFVYIYKEVKNNDK